MATHASTAPSETRASAYSWYVLVVLFMVYALNFIDRQIITILADDIQKDLDGQMSKVEQMQMMTQLFDRFAVAACVDPPIFLELKEARESDGLHVSEVDFEDKNFIFEWSQGGKEEVEASKSPNGKSAGNVADVPEGEGVGDSTVRSIRSGRNR